MTIDLPERNIEALKEVRERVLAHQIYMSSWIRFVDESEAEDSWGVYHTFMSSPVTEETIDHCGTKACLAGWAILNEAQKKGITFTDVLYRHVSLMGARYSTEVVAGADLLGLDFRTANQVFTSSWPLDLAWNDPDHQLAMVDGLIAGWYINDDGVWCTADGEPLTTDAL